MISQKTIKLYVYVDGVNDVPFYGDASGVYEGFILANGEVFMTSNGFEFNVRHTNEQIEIGAFRYDAKRMGGAPSISFTLMYDDCLDNFWSDKVYAVFNNEKYFLKQVPTSSRSSEDSRYKHEVELISERVALDNIYFFDAVVGNPAESDKAVSNSTKVTFFGSIHEFAQRLNASLEYTKLLKWEDGVDENGAPIKIANGYNVVVDEGIGSEEKLMSFEDQFISSVLQEIYNTYEVPYYFEGKTIHIGFSDDVYPHTLSYGVDNALVSITKNNANFKVVNRVTGKGSTDNIPYYYPNNSPKGIIDAEVNTTSENFSIEVVDRELYSDKVDIDEVIERVSTDYVINSLTLKPSRGTYIKTTSFLPDTPIHLDTAYNEDPFRFFIELIGQSSNKGEVYFELFLDDFTIYNKNYYEDTWEKYGQQHTEISVSAQKQIVNSFGDYVWDDTYFTNASVEIDNDTSSAHIKLPFEVDGNAEQRLRFNIRCNPFLNYGRVTCTLRVKEIESDGWVLGDKNIDLKDIGLRSNGLAIVGDTITQRLVKNVTNSKELMPSVYRYSGANERFYNAINYPYPKYEGFDETLVEDYYGEDGIQRNALGEYEINGMIHNDAYKEANGEYIVFKNPYFEGNPKEHSISIEDLKPTIKETVNSRGLRMDMFSEFAYDLDDNDETEENEDGTDRDYIHSYFFGKLRKLDFNLFECAIEQQPMTISFTSGNCGACNFEIGVTEEFPQKNPVQVNADGSLKRDEKGRVICGQFQEITEDEIQEEQQDTSKNEVWIALKKEESTYGILMPKAPIDGVGGHRPKACTVNEDGTANNDGDTFVILGIHLPDSYIHNAENKLRDEIIKYIKENNTEKFNFSITFSRIFFAENPDVLEYLNENSRVNVEYNGKTYTLYITSYSYNMGEGEVLPEIRVELDDTLTLAQNALQKAISQVKSEVGMAFANYDVLAQASPYFLRKDVDDICNGRVDFKKGIKFGEGGKVEVLDNNSAKLTIEYLEVTKKASFTSLEIKERTHVGGQIIISPAAMTCGEVEELEEAYRCYFQTRGENGGEEIFNQFAENDLAICQTFNAWGSRYYWRKVVGIGEDYIDLSKTICDEYSDIPMAGDKIIQLGNTDDATRQSAQVLSAYGEDSPSFIMYNGINDFTLADKNVTGIIWNPNTLEPQMYSYGSFFFGDRNLEDNFITFQQRDGDSEKKLHIKADVTFGSNSEGLSNLEEWKDVQTEIKGIVKTVENVQDQIDGVVENHFYQGEPTTSSEPASSWTTDTQKINHIGDTYTDISEIEEDPNAGKSWRWCRCDDMVGIEDYVEVTDKDGETYKLHWHPIADTDAVKALLKVYELEKKVSDADYLRDTFKNGSTEVFGGVVMSEMVAVKDKDGNIDAFLNGNDKFSDDERGTLILSAGIPDGDADKLTERSKDAATRIYEDGTIVSKNADIEGKISAKSGNIGDFSIEKGITATYDYKDASGFGTNSKVEIVPQQVFISHKSKQAKQAAFQGQATLFPAITEQPNGTTHAFGSMIICKITDTTYDDQTYPASCVGLIVSAEGAKPITASGLDGGNFAIQADKGMFAGLRPRTRVITSNGSSSYPHEISSLDHTIIINVGSGTTYIRLPASPQEGQVYEIYTCHHQMSLNINLNGKGLYNFVAAKDVVGTETFTTSHRRYITLVYASGQWWEKYTYW